MRYLLVVLLSLCALNGVQGQDIIRLQRLEKVDFRAVGASIIYGKFINRINIEGGFKQEIRLLNIDTKKIYSFCVMPPYSSKKSHSFCYSVPQGKYVVINYQYTDASMFGTTAFTESICKGDSCRSVIGAQIIIDTAKHYMFNVPVEGIYYTGTWDFKILKVSFADDKEKADKKIGKKYKGLNFLNAITAIPQ